MFVLSRKFFVFVNWALLAMPACAAPLTFERAVELAGANQPLLESQTAAVAAAQHNAVAATQLPDPKLKLGIVNVPTSGVDAYSLGRDFMTMRMIGVMQELPRAEKLRLRGVRAGLEADKEGRDLEVLRRILERDVGLAWLDAYAAEQARILVGELQQETASELDAMVVAYRVGRAQQADVLAARNALDLLEDRELDLLRQREQAQIMLTRWIGAAGNNPPAGTLPPLPAPDTPEATAQRLQVHPHLGLMEKQVALAETEVSLARNNRNPDWNVELSYNVRGPAYPDMVTLQFGIDLPVFPGNRQNQEIAAKQALLEKTRALREDNARDMQADISRYYAAWRANRQRAGHFENTVLPVAQARVEAALAAYRAGQGNFVAVLEARRALLDLRLQRLAITVDTTRAQVQLRYFE